MKIRRFVAPKRPIIDATRFLMAMYLAVATVVPSIDLHAQQINIRPSANNVVNTPMHLAVQSSGFICQVTVESVWVSAGDRVYVAFSNDKIWYRVQKAIMLRCSIRLTPSAEGLLPDTW